MNEANSNDSDVCMYQTCSTTHYCYEALCDNIQKMVFSTLKCSL